VGPLLDLAHNVSGFHLIIGDHTNAVVNTVVNGTPVIENKSFGASYARVRLRYAFADATVAPTVEIVTPNADMVTPDPAIVALLAPYRTQLAMQLDGKIAVTNGTFDRGNNVERLREMPIGDLVSDSLRLKYGAQLGFTNGGGIRAPLPSSYAPMDLTDRRPATGYAAGPPYDLVIGDIYTVLPFGNSAVTRTITGAQLWQMLEHSVSALPMAAGFFGQVSGFTFTFDSSRPAGMRVVSVQLDDGTAIPNDPASHYTLATSDFIDAGGDGYSFLAGGDGVSRDKMANILQDYVHQLATIDPATYGGHRITDVAPPPPTP
jgi:5'-nucleotidase